MSKDRGLMRVFGAKLAVVLVLLCTVGLFGATVAQAAPPNPGIRGTISAKTSGDLLEGILVDVNQWIDGGEDSNWVNVGSTSTGADGTFEFTGLAPGTYQISVYDMDEAYAGTAIDDIVVATSMVDIGAVKLSTWGAITGSTVDAASGANLPDIGIEVEMWNEDPDVPGEGDWWYATDGSSDAEGAFQFSQLEPGTYRLRFSDSNGVYASKIVDTLTVGEAVLDLGDVELAKAGSIKGSVKAEGGDPISGALVRVMASDEPFAFVAYDVTDDDGMFSISGCPDPYTTLDGDYVLVVSATGYESSFYNDAASLGDADAVSFSVGDDVDGIDFSLAGDSATLLKATPQQVSGTATQRAMPIGSARAQGDTVAWRASGEMGEATDLYVKTAASPSASAVSEIGPYDVNAQYLFVGDRIIDASTLAVVHTVDVVGVDAVSCDDSYATYLWSTGDGTSRATMVKLSDWSTVEFDLGEWNMYFLSAGATYGGKAVVATNFDYPRLLDFATGDVTVMPYSSNGDAVMIGSKILFANGPSLMLYNPATELAATVYTANDGPDTYITGLAGDGVKAIMRDWNFDGESFSNITYRAFNPATSVATVLRTEAPAPSDYPTVQLADVSGSYAFLVDEAGRVQRYPMTGGAPTRVDSPVYLAADHTKPSVVGGEVFFLDNRAYPDTMQNQRLYDLYSRKLPAAEKLEVTKVVDHFQADLPGSGADFLAYNADWTIDGGEGGLGLSVMNRSTGAKESIESDQDWNSFSAALDGDLLVYSDNPGGLGAVEGYLKAIDLKTGERFTAPVGAFEWDLHLAVSGDVVLCTDEMTGVSQSWNVRTNAVTTLGRTLPIGGGALDFDYPNVAFVDAWGGAGPLKIYNVQTGAETVVREFVALEAASEADQATQDAVAIQGDLIVAGNHVYSIESGDAFRFDSAGPVDQVDMDGTDLVYVDYKDIYYLSLAEISDGQVGSVSGVVKTQGGAPLTGVTVTLDGGSPQTTGASGGYQFSKIAAGDHSLKFELDGYTAQTVSVTIAVSGAVTKDVTMVAVGSTMTNVYRFYNKKNGSHFYTASEAEKSAVLKNLSRVYSLDGVAYQVNMGNALNNAPLHRFYNKKNGSHFYTSSEAEKSNVIKNLSAIYSYDGPAYNVCIAPPAGSTTVYRFYNKKNGSHFYTASETEKASVLKTLSKIYSLDGAAFYVAP